ncbi:MAG: DUF5132 domain-containing protein [Gammaproteobacteria bacterium]|jgi:Protein of unknown function (DUF5132)
MFNWLEDVAEAVSPNALVAAGVLLLGPILLPVVGRGLRPLAKGAIKGYLTVQDKVREYAAVSTEQLGDLVAEARSEHGAAAAGVVAAGEGASGSKERKAQSSSSGGKEKTA